mmetsp:Transcript_49033/g.77507  ORF Transcript_49033/g.77507 Transcript_49033/m.77507 type:complete len:1034 (-) Transcript_49033:311-3412(-)
MEARRTMSIADKMAVRLDGFRGDTQAASPDTSSNSSTPPKRRHAEVRNQQSSPRKTIGSVTTVAASARSIGLVTDDSARTASSLPLSRECTTAVVDIDCFSSAHAMEKHAGGRASETRRCLGKELEVFNMADDDEAVAPLLSGVATERVEGDVSTPSSRLSRRESSSTLTTTTNTSTMPEHDEQGDAWAVEDWCSQSSGSSHTSPCGAAQTLDRAQRTVADAVLSELQIDLQAQVQHALTQMNTWITEEISFASTSFKGDMEQAVELVLTSWRKEFLDLQSVQSGLSCQLDTLRESLEKQNSPLRESNIKETQSDNDQTPATWKNECLALKTCHAELDYKLQSLQTSIEEQIQAMQRSCESTSRSIQPSIQAELHSSHSELDCKIRLLQSNFEEHTESMKRELENRSLCTQPCTQNDLHNMHAELDCKIKALQGSMEEQIQSARRFSEDSSHWIQQRTQHESQPQPSSKVMEARVVAEERKWRMKLDQFQDNLSEHLRRIETLDSQSEHLMRKAATNDLGLEKVASSVRELDSRLLKASREELAVKESLERRMHQMELMNFPSRIAELDTVTKDLVSKSQGIEAKVTGDILQTEKLEKRVQNIEVMNLSVRVSELDAATKLIFNKSEDAEARLAVDGEHRHDMDKRIREIESLNLAHRIVALDNATNSFIKKSECIEEELTGQSVQNKNLEKRINNIELMNLSGTISELDDMTKLIFKKSEDVEERLTNDIEERQALDKRIREIEHMNIAHRIAELGDVANDAVSRSECMEAKWMTDLEQQQKKIEGFQCSLGEHLARLDTLDEQKDDLAEKLAVLAGTSEESRSALRRLETQHIAVEKDIADIRKNTNEYSEKLDILEDGVAEIKEHMVAVDHRIEEHTWEILSLKGFPAECQAQLHAIEERFSKIVRDLGDDFNHSATELSAIIHTKAARCDLQCIENAVQTWVEDARTSHRISVEALAASLEQVQASSLQQNIELKKHQEYMKELSAFINDGVERETCINDVLLHIVEEDHPDLMVLLEQRLRQTSRVAK